MVEIEAKLTSLKQYLIKNRKTYDILKELGLGYKKINGLPTNEFDDLYEKDLDNFYEKEFDYLFDILSDINYKKFKKFAKYIKILYLKKVIFADNLKLSIYFQIQDALNELNNNLKNKLIENIELSCISRAYDCLNKQSPMIENQIEIAVNEYGIIYIINKENIQNKIDILEPVQNLITTIIFSKIDKIHELKTCVGYVADACQNYHRFIIQNRFSDEDPKVDLDNMIYQLFEYICKSFKEINYPNFCGLFNEHFERCKLDIYFEEGNDKLLKEEIMRIPIYQKNLNDYNKYPKLAIHKVKNKNGFVARKIVECINDNHKNSYHDEIQILTNLNDVDNRNQSQINHFPKFYDKSVILKDNKIIYDMELFDDNLEDFINKKTKKIDEHTAGTIAVHLLEGFILLEKNNIMHNDIKPKNIMIKNHNGKTYPIIIDFNASINLQDYSINMKVKGTREFMSPEFREALETNKDLQITKSSIKSDVFSLGLTILFMYYKDKVLNMNQQDSKQKLIYLINNLESDKMKHLLDVMLRFNENERTSFVRALSIIDPNNDQTKIN